MYQVIILKDEKNNKNYYQSYVESDDTTLGNITVDDLPPYADLKKARSCFYKEGEWIFDNEKYEEIKKEIENEEIENLVNPADSVKLALFAKAIQVENAPTENGKKLPKKKGYKWEQRCIIDNGLPRIIWELVKDKDYKKENDGSDYTQAIIWKAGDRVTQNLWYNVGNDLIWQAIKTGIPSGPEDRKYFDII